MKRGRTFWDWLAESGLRWPTERQWVTILLAVLIGSLLKMADVNPHLWDVEVFKVIVQAAVLTGALNMVLAFHFAANKSDEDKTANSGKAFEAIKAAAEAGTQSAGDDAPAAAQATADAAQDKADEISGIGP